MDKLTEALFDALRATLWKQQPDAKCYEGWSDKDWYAFYKLASLQTVEGLVYDGLTKLPDTVAIPRELILKWSVRMQQLEERNRKMNSVMEEQLEAFRELGIRPILQKGQGLAQYYPEPLHRNSGDIDWYFADKEQYAKVWSLAKTKGSGLDEHMTDANFMWKGVVVELHQRLIETRNPLQWKFIKGLEKEHEAQNSRMKVGTVYATIPAPIMNVLLVNLHILKHQIGYGLGLRQFCDAAVLYHVMDGLYDKRLLTSYYKKLGVTAWTQVFHRLLVQYLGLSEDKLPYPLEGKRKYEWMMDDVLRGGNFGFYDPEHDDASAATGRINRGMRIKSSVLKYICLAPQETIIFPFYQTFNRLYRMFKK